MPFLVIICHINPATSLVSFVLKVTLAFTLRQLWNRPFSNTMSLKRPSVSCINWSKFSFLSMWDNVSTELLWTLSIQVSKNTTTKKQTAKASNTTNKKEKNEKGNNFDTSLMACSRLRWSVETKREHWGLIFACLLSPCTDQEPGKG